MRCLFSARGCGRALASSARMAPAVLFLPLRWNSPCWRSIGVAAGSPVLLMCGDDCFLRDDLGAGACAILTLRCCRSVREWPGCLLQKGRMIPHALPRQSLRPEMYATLSM